MKRWLILALLLVATVACTQTYYLTDGTLTWDAPTEGMSGAPFEPTDVLEFEMARDTSSGGIPGEVLALVSGVLYDFTVPNDGQAYWYAVRAKLTTDEGATVLFSDWLWADFTIKHPSIDRPTPPVLLRIQ